MRFAAALLALSPLACAAPPHALPAQKAPAPPVCNEGLTEPAPQRQGLLRVEPAMPKRAIEMNQEGWVCLGFDVDEDGNVENSGVLASSPEGLYDQSALTAIRQWRYVPGGKTKGMRVMLHFLFD